MTAGISFTALPGGALGVAHSRGAAPDSASIDFRPVAPVEALITSSAPELGLTEIGRQFLLYPGVAGVEDLDDELLAQYAASAGSGQQVAQIVWLDGCSAIIRVSGEYGPIPWRLWHLAYKSALAMKEQYRRKSPTQS